MVNTVVAPDTLWVKIGNYLYPKGGDADSLMIGGSYNTPMAMLDVNGSARIGGNFRIDGDATFMGDTIWAWNHFKIGYGDTSVVGSQPLFPENSGNLYVYDTVAIGTMTPEEKLHVNGKFKVEDNILLNANWLSNDGGNEGVLVSNTGIVKVSSKLGIGIDATVGINIYSTGDTPQLRLHDGDISGIIEYSQFTPTISNNTTGVFETVDDTYGGLSISGLLKNDGGSASTVAILISGITAAKGDPITVAPIVFRAIEGIDAPDFQAISNGDPCITFRNYTTDLATFYPEKTQILNTFVEDVGVIANGDATPDVSGANTWTYAGGSNVTITDLDNPVVHATYLIIGGGEEVRLTINDGGNFNVEGASIVLYSDDNVYIYVQADNDYIQVSKVVDN